MKRIVGLAVAMLLASCSAPDDAEEPVATQNETTEATERPALLPAQVEERFARLALDCIHREYPNKISHVLISDEDVRPPRELTPAFYGCFDWHSSVHGHWLLARVLNTSPDGPLAEEIRAALAQSFTAENIAGELAYFSGEDRGSFERPYGLAWFLQLVAELDESEDPQMQEWRETLRPLEDKIVGEVQQWLPKLAYPIRLGTHNQSAFAFGLMLDYARSVGNGGLSAQISKKSLEFHRDDVDCPLSYEPSGEDFLSPCLMEADLMRRVLPQDAFAGWLTRFLPQIPQDGSATWLEPGVVRDASDGKLVHLDGVNLSRAWALEGIASGLPPRDPRNAALLAAADVHREAGLAAVSDEHYAGSHWLASFATYLTTRRGIVDRSIPGESNTPD